ncbi:hypothetical protein IP91_01222 [Pseudoduganella lurida]|uniref:UrcA family protein n=1 Tax=Pseudoduganella lurida TaxID=1036180 RepID=A0A562RM93_9BURK|nr:hypothetical protein [Pseudoduganella lurida]TWI70142.1 hypothetical protein IP91_01222 [Pseudoduganella lurida]
MKRLILGAALVGLCGVAAAQSTPPAVVQHQQGELARGEPARWLKEDGGAQAQMAIKRKEIGAALNEALNDCRKMSAGERAGCVKEARATYARDLANVKELVAQSNTMGGVRETVVPVQ